MQRLVSEVQRCKRIIRDQDGMLQRASTDVKNATKTMNERIHEANIKIRAASCFAKFILPRLPSLEILVETVNLCCICPERANVQLGTEGGQGCLHKYCYACVAKMLDYGNIYNTGLCPSCRREIVEIRDAEYAISDDPEYFVQIQV